MSLPFMPSHWSAETRCADEDSRSRPFVIVESRNDRGVTIERAELHYVSRNGVVIRSTTLKPLPNEITILFPDDGLQRLGRVRWRDDRAFGVELDGSIALPERWRRDSHSANRLAIIEGGCKPGCRIVS